MSGQKPTLGDHPHQAITHNTDRIINSDQVQSVIRTPVNKVDQHVKKKNDLKKTSLEKYSTKTETGWQSIQYDQGEDRWLCTLLIIRGWEVINKLAKLRKWASRVSFGSPKFGPN